MLENLELKKLPDDVFAAVQGLLLGCGDFRSLDPNRHVGSDIFDERNQPVVKGRNGIDGDVNLGSHGCDYKVERSISRHQPPYVIKLIAC